VAVHAEDKALVLAKMEKLKQANKNDAKAFLRAHSEEVELKAIQRLLRIAEPTGVHLHFCHVSTEEGLDAVVEAKKSGRHVTCEVTPNHLLLSNSEVERYEQKMIMMPPLRSKSNIEALW
jgi:dihydroorotase